MDRIYLVAVAVDGSPASRYAFELIKVLLEPLSGNASYRIVPIHIWGDWEPYTHDTLFPFAPLGSDIVEFEREIETVARGYIDKWLDLTGKESYVGEPQIFYGRCGRDLPVALLQGAYNFVAMGAYGVSGPKPHYVGSVAYRTLQGSLGSVLIARPNSTQMKVERVTVAIDLTNRSEVLIAKGIMAAMATKANLDLIYVFPDPTSVERSDVLSSVIDFDSESVMDAARGKIAEYFGEMMERLKGEVPFPLHDCIKKCFDEGKILCGDPADTIVNYCIENKTDLLVLGKHDPSCEPSARVGRVAQRVLFNAPCSLFFQCLFKKRVM